MSVRPITRRLTDAQLVSAQFRYSDPENSIAGLNLGVPDPEAHPIIIGYYDETPPGGRAGNPNATFIRCCHCGKRRHWKGHVVRDDRGETYIIGASQCGREHYGVRYDDAEKAFKAEQARRAALIRWTNMVKLVANYRSEVTQLLQAPALGELDLKRDELRRACSEGFGKLVRIATSAEPMFETREERDYEAEKERQTRFERAWAVYQALPSVERRRRRDEGLKPEEDTSPIYRRASTPLGHLVGGGFLTDRGDARQFALDLRKTLDAVGAVDHAGTDSATTTDLNRLLREMTDKPRALDKALAEASFASLFFERENLDRIERWSSGEARFSYQRDGAALVIEDGSLRRARIEPLDKVEFPYHRSLQAAEYLDDQFLPEIVEAA